MLRSLVALMLATAAFAQPPDNPTPKTFPPDAATLKKIQDKTAELEALLNRPLDPKFKVPVGLGIDLNIYLKAAEWVVRHNEWYSEKTAQQTLDVLDAGMARCKAYAEGKTPWLDVRGKSIIRAYSSQLDGSVQPYSVRYPDDYDPKKKYRLDLILHGRDATLTEVKFIHAKETAKPGKPLDHFEVEVYGRGNNAYRWAGEADASEALLLLRATEWKRGAEPVDTQRIVLRGFSMGGAGTWHLGLHDPFQYAVLGPGAGFTTTRGYIGEKKFGPQPDYIEKCLHIYDAVDYAENVFNVPVVAYSGEKDKQKLAADLIEAKLKDFKEPHSFTHLIAPGLEHKQPPEWMAKLETEYQKYLKDGRNEVPERVRFVTYTSKYGGNSWASIFAQAKQYERSEIDAKYDSGNVSVRTTNVRVVLLSPTQLNDLRSVTIDGQQMPVPDRRARYAMFVKDDRDWKVHDTPNRMMKVTGVQGPIDDALTRQFVIVRPSEKPWTEETGAFSEARRTEFLHVWDKYFRGQLGSFPANRAERFGNSLGSILLFGDPQSNPMIAKVLPKLPIKWTKDELVMNGVKYDPKTHVPVLIYPNPLDPRNYVVINSGHTFREADLKGTNALLYPRLGDWAVLKPKPTKDDPAGFEVVAAGLFDENWQFEKKK